ncbi:MAG: hypothetical protein MSH22_04035 [Spirochaetia bacterium]|nr:hypothetical protein [Spirochaetia bacterium]
MLKQLAVCKIKESLIIYIHGKGGNAGEGEYYKKFFPDFEIYGFDYKSNTPWLNLSLG